MTTEIETVADVVAEMREVASHPDRSALEEVIFNSAQRIAIAHARDAKDAARYRAYRATTVKPELFGGDGWSEEDTDRVIDTAMSTPTREVIR